MMTNVSCKGDKPYVQLLGLLAKRKDVPIGILVRNALDEVYGAEIAELKPIADALFFATDGACKHQSCTERNKKESHHDIHTS